MSVSFLLSWAIAAGLVLAADSSVRLSYVFKIGDEYKIKQVTTQKITQSIMGLDQVGNNEYTGMLSLKVAEVSREGARLTAHYETIRNRSTSIMGEIIMDSDGDLEQTQNKFCQGFMNKPFYLSMDKTGRIVSVEGLGNLHDGVRAAMGDTEVSPAVKQVMEQMLNESSVKNNLSQVLVYYSDRQVKPGDSWKSINQLPMGFPIAIDITWNLISLSPKQADVRAEGLFTTTDKEKIVDLPNGMRAKVDLSGNQTTNSVVDPGTGWPTSMKLQSELKGKMLLLASGMIPMDLELPTRIQTETQYTITRK